MIIASHKKEKTTTTTRVGLQPGMEWVAGLGWFSHSWLKTEMKPSLKSILSVLGVPQSSETIAMKRPNGRRKGKEKQTDSKTDRPTITTIIGTRIATDADVASSLHN